MKVEWVFINLVNGCSSLELFSIVTTSFFIIPNETCNRFQCVCLVWVYVLRLKLLMANKTVVNITLWKTADDDIVYQWCHHLRISSSLHIVVVRKHFLSEYQAGEIVRNPTTFQYKKPLSCLSDTVHTASSVQFCLIFVEVWIDTPFAGIRMQLISSIRRLTDRNIWETPCGMEVRPSTKSHAGFRCFTRFLRKSMHRVKNTLRCNA